MIMAQSPKKKVIRITLEIEVGDRKVWLSKIRGAYQLGAEMMVEALQEALPEDAIVDVHSRLEWFYLYERSDATYDTENRMEETSNGSDSAEISGQ
jgi:hypothetical protein